MPLSEPHRGSLSATSRSIELAIDEIEELISAKTGHQLTRQRVEDLDAEDIGRLKEDLKRLREANKRMFVDLNLTRSAQSIRQVINAKLTYVWTVILDSRSRTLGRYGMISKEDRDRVDQHVDTITKILQQILSSLSTERKE
jgi:DNA-binding transcriptional MerR regulator